MHPTKRSAHIAGALYLLLALTAPLYLVYVPATLIVRGNAAATAEKILSSERLFRMGILSELVSGVIAIFLVLALYNLFKGVNQMHASLVVILGALVSVPISFVNAVNHIAALTLLRGADFLTVFDKPQREALAMLFVRMHGHGILVNEIFWGLWLFPFGLLVMRSGFLPRILGILLIINGFAYLAISLTSLLLPDYASVVRRMAMIPLTGELWIMLWLLIRGARVDSAAAA